MDWKLVIQRIKSGDYTELENVYKEYRLEFFRWIVKQYNCSHEDAQDIYQQSMIIFYENIVTDKITALNSGIKTYLFAIGKNKYFELMRDKHKQNIELSEYHTPAEEEDAEVFQEDMDKVTELERSLKQIGDPCKSILELYYYHRKSMQDIAEKLGLKNTDTAKNMKYKCLQRLKSAYNTTIAY